MQEISARLTHKHTLSIGRMEAIHEDEHIPWRHLSPGTWIAWIRSDGEHEVEHWYRLGSQAFEERFKQDAYEYLRWFLQSHGESTSFVEFDQLEWKE